MISRSEIRSLVEAYGPEGYLQIQHALLEGRTLPNGVVKKVRPEEFSLRALWEGLIGPVEETLGYGQKRFGYIETPRQIEEAVSSTAFPSATGQLIAAKVIEGYNAPGYIGDELVTVMPSTLRGERVVGFTSLQGPKEVGEGAAYEGSTFEEKYVTTTEAKKGRLLDITEEAVYFDQTGQLLMRAEGLGEVTRAERERVIVRGVADVVSTVRVYRPGGTAEQLYASGNNNRLATATPLVDWTDIQEVFQYHALNVRDDRETDDALGTQPLIWVPKILLTAVELAGTAARIVSATQVGTPPGATATAAMLTGNPLNTFVAGGLRALSSPYLDAAEGADQWDDASDWFLGDFKKQFIWKEIWPLQVFRAPAQNEEQFTRDIVARFKVRYYGGLNAIDERYVIQVNAVT